MPRRCRHRHRHRLSLLRLAHSRALPWLARALALLLILGNAFAVAAPVRMLAMATSSTMPAMHHASGPTSATVAPTHPTTAMQHHHHSATMAADVEQASMAPHGSGCPCCDNGHCQCPQACSPLPQIAAAMPAALLLSVFAPAPMRVAGAISIVDAPPLRPPIA